MNQEQKSLLKHLFRDDKISEETIATYDAHLSKFTEEWQTAREALGEDWRYADSLRSAGLLAEMREPIVQTGKLAGHTTLYRICGVSRETQIATGKAFLGSSQTESGQLMAHEGSASGQFPDTPNPRRREH